MAQREIQMSIEMSKARDSLLIFGSVYSTLVSGITVAKLAGKPVPAAAAIPFVVGGVMLGNMWDFAYGTKLQRVVAEAEYIMANEKHRFLPPKQAPFYKVKICEERTTMLRSLTHHRLHHSSQNYSQDLIDKVSGTGAVSTYVPPFLPWSR